MLKFLFSLFATKRMQIDSSNATSESHICDLAIETMSCTTNLHKIQIMRSYHQWKRSRTYWRTSAPELWCHPPWPPLSSRAVCVAWCNPNSGVQSCPDHLVVFLRLGAGDRRLDSMTRFDFWNRITQIENVVVACVPSGAVRFWSPYSD